MLAEKMSNDVEQAKTSTDKQPYRMGFGPSGFSDRHIGPSQDDVREMVKYLGKGSLQAVIDAVIPSTVKTKSPLYLSHFPRALSEFEAIERIKGIASKNKVN